MNPGVERSLGNTENSQKDEKEKEEKEKGEGEGEEGKRGRRRKKRRRRQHDSSNHIKVLSWPLKCIKKKFKSMSIKLLDETQG